MSPEVGFFLISLKTSFDVVFVLCSALLCSSGGAVTNWTEEEVFSYSWQTAEANGQAYNSVPERKCESNGQAEYHDDGF